MPRMPYTNFHDINLDWVIKQIKKAFTPDNPPPYPVKSVNGLTGDVTVTGDIIPVRPGGVDVQTALNEKQTAPNSPGAPGQVLGLDTNQTPVWLTPQGGGGDVTDVKIDQSSIVDQNGVAVIPLAGVNNLGVVLISYGLNINNGTVRIERATSGKCKAGTERYNPITPAIQNYSTFYGLASASGDTTMANSNNPLGVYTDEAIDKILTMLGVYTRILSPAGNTHTLLPCPFSYAFGEKAELNITVTANSEYHFSFSCPVGTPTVLTMTGATATSGDVILEAGGYYDINVWNGVALYRKLEVTGG